MINSTIVPINPHTFQQLAQDLVDVKNVFIQEAIIDEETLKDLSLYPNTPIYDTPTQLDIIVINNNTLNSNVVSLIAY